MDTLTVSPPADTTAQATKRYLFVWAVALVAMLGAAVGLCVFVDPYSVIGTPRIAGINRDKPAAADWPRLTKAYTVQRADPVTLIVGNSSADVGFNPDSNAWPQAARPVFNLAVDGGLPSTHLRYLQHALAVTHPAHVVIAINFIESLLMSSGQMTAAAQDQFAFEARMLVRKDGSPNPGYRQAHFDDLVFATLSFTAVSDSIRTLLHQNDAAATYETPSGWNNGGKFHRWAREDGFRELVVRKDREKIPQLMEWKADRTLDVAPVAAMVRLARAHGAAVTIVILPNYVDEMQSLRQLGLDPDYDAWKSDIVKGVAQAAPDGGATIWDFSGYNQYTTEPLPGPGDRKNVLHWFWEPVHFQTTLGDLMIARIEGAPAPADLGVRLSAATLPVQIAAFHAGEAAWEKTHPDDIARVAAIVQAR
jgi:hypothetical protein